MRVWNDVEPYFSTMNRWLILLVAFTCISCARESCDDGKLNQDEIRIDCGGASCDLCPTCFDGIQNQDELDTDCGGVCNACPPIWVEVSSGVNVSLNSIAFANESDGFIVGDQGTLLASSDGGKTWTKRALSTTADLNAIQFAGNNNVYLVGDRVLMESTDGGTSWSEISLPLQQNWKTLWFFGDEKGLIAGSDMTVLRTTDGGDSWLDRSPNSNSRNDIVSAHFTTSNSGYLVGNGSIYLTSSGGGFWVETFAFDVGNSRIVFDEVTDVYFANENRGFLCASVGILVSESSIWLDKNIPVRNGFIDMNGSAGLYAGLRQSGNEGVIYFSSDNGIIWKEENFPSAVQGVTDVEQVDEVTGLIVNDEGRIFLRQNPF